MTKGSLATMMATLCCMVAFLAGCGGGKSAKSGEVIDPSSSFKGAQSQAVPTQENATDLALGGLSSLSLANAMQSTLAKTSGNSSAKPLTNRPAFQLTQLLKQSVRRMELPEKARVARSRQSAGAAKSLARASNYQLPGDSGGTATYALDVNDAAGTLFGTVVYQGFTSDGIVIDGTTEILATLDSNRQQVSHLALSFRSISFHTGNSTVSLTGSLSWGFNFVSSTEALSMNMVLVDQGSAKTYWFNNYQVVSVYFANGFSQTISGRYYDHDHGYVDLTTRTPLVIGYGNQWPSEGSLRSSGQFNRWVGLNFLPTSVVIEADTDANGAADWQVEQPTNASPPINSPPTADAGADQNATQWAVVQLDGSASSDSEGDPLSYTWSVISGPGYAALADANSATATFTPNLVGTYVLGLTVYDGNSISEQDTVTVVVTSASPSDQAFVAQKWQYGRYGSSIGLTGLFTSDLDGDGAPEIIAGASAGGFGNNIFWYVLRRNASGGYEQVWRSPIYSVNIIRILLSDMNGDGKDDVVVALADGVIRVYDGPTLDELAGITVAASLKDLAIDDLDGDGIKEVVTSDGIGVSVYNAVTGVLKWSVATGGGNAIAVGNVDSDSTLEIVATNYGGKGWVLNGLSGAAKWEYINGFGSRMRLADLDGDGMQEIIGASSWYKITVFDADIKSPAWEIATSHDIGTLTVTDADGDGVPEILYGDGQWGEVHAVDVRSRKEIWSVNNPEAGVSGIAVGDVDLDGKKEVLWGAGGSSTGADFLFIADMLTGEVKWKNMDFSGLSCLTVGDVDDDGEDEIIMVTESSNSGYDGGIINIFSAKSHALKYQQDLGTRDWMGDQRAVRIGDVDGDGHAEFVVSSSDLYDGFIRVYGGATHTVKLQSAGYGGNFFSAIAIGDVDNDGKVEIVAGMGREHTGAKGV